MILPWIMKKKTRDLTGPRVRSWLISHKKTVESTPDVLVCVLIPEERQKNGRKQ